MPSAPAFETAAASRGTATMGARTIGCSIPSNSHTGVLTAFAPSAIVAGRQVAALEQQLGCHVYEVGVAPGDRRSQP